ncbi:DUF3558 domain-containing protein [Nocardia brasiliensis]|uniref:DUF3558 domain-containing protein n=1 Tax=Nocardia brasiliensis TaxID=37326 RepID=UPI0036712BC7
MNRRRGSVRGILTAAALLTIAATASGCGQTISGSAFPAGAGNGDNVNTKFDKLLRECEIVTLDQVAEAVAKGSYPQQSFYGAVCMWDLQGAPGGNAMVTLNWYETGALNNEKTTNDKLGYLTNNITVQGRRALETRRPNDPDSCGVSAGAADQGVIGFWVNYRPGSAHADPCAAAKQLVELTLNLAR